ncbi:hypothetical protein KY284_020371 [Solanum tuberosum]|nr:hypothetical protein KY284_020371 [Solanum tuberosum]
MEAFNSPNPQMVVDVNYKLRSWWIDIKRDREREIRHLLGGLTYLIFVIPNPHLIRALLEFWDPVRMVFKFVDFDLAPTIEEISGFIDMPYHECEMIVPYEPSSREFLQSLGMKSNPTLPSLDLGWIHFDFLYSRFGRVDRSLVFLKKRGKIDTRLCYVVRDLVQRKGEPRKTLVPMILAEIMRSLSACVDGRMFFEGCNILLQLWAIEHFYLRSDAVDIFLGYGNKINNHPRRMVAFTAPVGFVDWQIFLTELESYRIQRKLHWLSTPHAIVRGDDRYFIELIGLKGTMVYHTRSKDSLPSLPNENHKGKRKATNEKVMSKTIEKKHPSDELVSSLKKKIRELEEEVSDMRGWAKLLLSVDPTLETNIDKPPITSQATLQDNPPPTHLTSHPPPTYPTSQNQPSSIQMPPKNTHFPNSHILLNVLLMLPDLHILLRVLPYKLLNIKHLYTKSLGTVRRSYHIESLHIKCLHIKSLLILFTMSKPSLKNIFPIDQFYEKLRLAGHIAPISEIRMNTRAKWVEPSKVCAYHSGMKGHTIEEYRDLKNKIQQLIDTKIICLEDFEPAEPQQ